MTTGYGVIKLVRFCGGGGGRAEGRVAAGSGGVFRSREGGCGCGRCGSPLAREIPDISRHGFAAPGNSGMTMLFFSLRIAPVSGESVDHGIWGHKTCPLLRRGREEGRRQGCRGGGGCFSAHGRGGCGGGRCGSPLAREIPDISRHGFAAPGNSGMTMLFFSLRIAPVSGESVDHGRVCERIPLELLQRRPFRAVASRQRSRNSGGRPRLAAEIPDIFLPLARNDVRNDDGWGVVAVCSEGDCVSKRWTRERPHTAYRRWAGNTRGFDFFSLEDSFTQIGGGRIRCAGRPQEWSFGAVPPQSDGTRVKALWFFGVGILSHDREWSFGIVPPHEWV